MTKKGWIISILIFIVFASGCGNAEDTQPNVRNTNQNDRISLLNQPSRNEAEDFIPSQTLQVVFNQVALEQVPSYIKEGETRVPLVPVLETLNFNVREQDQLIQAGFSDVLIEVARTHEKELVTTTELAQILGEGAAIEMNQDQLIIHLEENYEQYGFPEKADLDDLASTINQEQPQDIPVVTTGRANNIIGDGLDYRGVPYYFGAPSGYTKAFDCSSFTQYVYGTNGIRLPRVSRDQAKLGSYVPVNDLKKGDLLFFHWPGRNVLVGHVGIYAGDGYMLHSSPVPKDGVQLTNILDSDSPFKEAYLGAKRISEANDLD